MAERDLEQLHRRPVVEQAAGARADAPKHASAADGERKLRTGLMRPTLLLSGQDVGSAETATADGSRASSGPGDTHDGAARAAAVAGQCPSCGGTADDRKGEAAGEARRSSHTGVAGWDNRSEEIRGGGDAGQATSKAGELPMKRQSGHA
ncbi:hypothetical protein PF005_g1304 [Phytophthora fragariae]|uniref:Uncharacterized protein n=1 Tax=Phytophthora fragariae TaxID=53985 RepID=A0A6A3TXI0_9STRA|nr:hypothetical protein PF003_g4184 [Phytophthora fragariae]KAE8949112.1 hypothetical protein PF009_g1326 [Phytophthora fragariae]KAE9138991.1 hypothetical protein PF007_g1194 [Phytophthora fragariae]KAE9155000.1 hypothetical protein PF006_g1035 [Phytophthora fragariae]KAE9235854.1 hypothetical protein PF005_g1304 [Phytophthora fragariae]